MSDEYPTYGEAELKAIAQFVSTAGMLGKQWRQMEAHAVEDYGVPVDMLYDPRDRDDLPLPDAVAAAAWRRAQREAGAR